MNRLNNSCVLSAGIAGPFGGGGGGLLFLAAVFPFSITTASIGLSHPQLAASSVLAELCNEEAT